MENNVFCKYCSSENVTENRDRHFFGNGMRYEEWYCRDCNLDFIANMGEAQEEEEDEQEFEDEGMGDDWYAANSHWQDNG